MARHLITSALPYINGVKHLGNLVGSMLPADVYARFLRQRGHDVLFLCASDEHGTPAELAAQEARMPVQAYCDQQHALQRELGERFLLSWDHFGRSSSRENRELTQHFADRLQTNGYIDERDTAQLFSSKEGRFLPDRYIIGTCPLCGSEQARGDQCESCGAMLEPTDLIDARSSITGSTDLELRTTRHLYLRQSLFVDRLQRWHSSKHWPLLTTSITTKWLDEGLQDRCITRDLTWGVPVNRDGFEQKVFYVWFDAPIEYIAAAQEWANASSHGNRPDWKSWWLEANDVTYTQFMAKDNVPFHTLSFPCTVMGTGEPWKLADYIKAFNWLTYYGGKFSTSQQIGVFMDDALQLLPADYWRWFLIANAPESSDTSFTWPLFGKAVNKDLCDTLGNFVSRTFAFAQLHFTSRVPVGGQLGLDEKNMIDILDDYHSRYTASLERLEFRKAAQHLRRMWSLGNQYFQHAAPWRTIETDRCRTETVMRTALNMVYFLATVSAPIIPASSRTILNSFSSPAELHWPSSGQSGLQMLPPGAAITSPGVLFEKVTPEQLRTWEHQFGGA